MRPFNVFLTATAGLLASTSLSTAATTSETVSKSAGTNWGTSTADVSFSPTFALAFAGFDTSLGTLTGVSLFVEGTVTGKINLTNNAQPPSDPSLVSGHLNNTLKFNAPGLTTKTLGVLSASVSQTLAALASTGDVSVFGSNTNTYTPSNISLYSSAWSALAGTLGEVTTSSANGNGSATYVDTGAVTFVATYTYNPRVVCETDCPEPASMAVLGAGLTGMGLLRRRKKAA